MGVFAPINADGKIVATWGDRGSSYTQVTIDYRSLVAKLRKLGYDLKSLSSDGTLKTRIYQDIYYTNIGSNRPAAGRSEGNIDSKYYMSQDRSMMYHGPIFDIPKQTGMLAFSPMNKHYKKRKGKHSTNIANGNIDERGIWFNPYTHATPRASEVSVTKNRNGKYSIGKSDKPHKMTYDYYYAANLSSFRPMWDVRNDVAKGEKESKVLQIVKKHLVNELKAKEE